MYRPHVFFVMGTTCSGKSSWIDYVYQSQDSLLQVQHVSIGKILRERYPPEHFKGKAALPETEQEVRNIFSEKMSEYLTPNKNIPPMILVDGIPRLPSQMHFSLTKVASCRANFLLFRCDEEIARRRAEQRFPNDKGSLQLALDRITNDKITQHDVLVELFRAGISVKVFDTDKPQESYRDYVLNWCRKQMIDG